MSPQDRERQIVNQAIQFFAKHGFEGQLRFLTEELGITHTLLYHYFPTKQDLIDRVYQEVVVQRWKPEWEELLNDPKISPEQKLLDFYIDYAQTILTFDFVRILIFSGLADKVISDRFFNLLQTTVIPKLIRETRRYCGIKSQKKPTSQEIEHLMGLHGGIFYLGIRRWIYGPSFQIDMSAPTQTDNEIVQERVTSYLLAAQSLFKKET
jgi:AcrR family transcriptional regulator